ncbi:ImuA family protein [Chryseolinea lacunae]|uniref:Error-prone repair protein ImuA n=1 Tax=Chryseolinea lacunae TaxID=2801331 RepID=A0ABS1KVQ5_9BACT|nr:Error-prone repair protein ImuA [Chryseolinea lacunae]MBL0743551.1 Error-prone repair protein ImuA [Chryseolinea lacunae]
MVPLNKADAFAALQMDILRLQGFKSSKGSAVDVGLGPILHAFPKATFPVGAVHEFLASQCEEAAATSGFVAGLLSALMGPFGTALWISASRTLFPPALKTFGIQPDRFVFVDLQKEKDVLWAMDEALKCGALTAVVGEVHDISFKASRRLQLAVEQSQVTGFVLRNNARKPGTTACVSRWQITPLPSDPVDDLPGVGFPQWKVELLRIRNGKPGVWDLQWTNGRFQQVYKPHSVSHEQSKKVG